MTQDPYQTSPQEAQVEAEARARQVAAEAVEVRQRTREAFVDMFRQRAPLAGLREISRAMMDGAVEGAREVAPQERENVLRQVIDGLGEGFIITANATRLALEEARGRGESFAREDVEKVVNDLESAERAFVDGVTHAISRTGQEFATTVKNLNDHALNAVKAARPSIQSALGAAASHPVMLARETASAGLRAVPKTAGMFIQAMAGVLQGAGDLLTGADRPPPRGPAL